MMRAALRILRRNGWTRGKTIALLGLLAAAVAATSDAWQDLVSTAIGNEESSHIMLAPVVAAWLVWVRRERLRNCPIQGTWIGPVFVVFGWVLYSFGDLMLIQAFWHAGAVLIAMGCFLSLAGAQVLVRFLPAFLILGFLVPVPGFLRQAIAIPLERITAMVTQRTLEVIGIATDRSGNVIEIKGVQVAIAEACNGMRMVFALFFVSVAFAFGTPLRFWVRVTIIVLSPITAILCNVIRLLPTVWLFGHSPIGVAETFHDLAGWLMLPVSFLMLMGVIRALRWALIPVHRYTLADGA